MNARRFDLYLHQIVPEGTQRVLFCSWSIVLLIWAHINIKLAPAWIVSEIKRKKKSIFGLKIIKKNYVFSNSYLFTWNVGLIVSFETLCTFKHIFGIFLWYFLHQVSRILDFLNLFDGLELDEKHNGINLVLVQSFQHIHVHVDNAMLILQKVFQLNFCLH